jgi:hypothetical protein
MIPLCWMQTARPALPSSGISIGSKHGPGSDQPEVSRSPAGSPLRVRDTPTLTISD